jgi:hypothetical protein
MGGGVARGPAADQAVPAIHRDVVPIAKGRHGEIHLRRAILARFVLIATWN